VKFQEFLAQLRKIKTIPRHPVLIQTPLPNLPSGKRLGWRFAVFEGAGRAQPFSCARD
jgi:hypothetical protein